MKIILFKNGVQVDHFQSDVIPRIDERISIDNEKWKGKQLIVSRVVYGVENECVTVVGVTVDGDSEGLQ